MNGIEIGSEHPGGTKECQCHTSFFVSDFYWSVLALAFPGGSVDKEYSCNAGDAGDPVSITGSGSYSGGGHDNPLQYSCLENSMD